MPATKAVNPRATLTFEYLCDVLLRAKLVTQEQWRDALSKGDVVHARLLRQRAGGVRKKSPGAGDGVHPAEVIAALGLARPATSGSRWANERSCRRSRRTWASRSWTSIR